MVLIGVIGFAAASPAVRATPGGGYAETWMISARASRESFAALLMPAAIATVYATAPARSAGARWRCSSVSPGHSSPWARSSAAICCTGRGELIFWINIPVAVAAVMLILMAEIPSNRLRPPHRLGRRRLVAAAMSTSVIGFTQCTDWGWHSCATWAFLVRARLPDRLRARRAGGLGQPLVDLAHLRFARPPD